MPHIVTVPSLGGANHLEVVEILVQVGQHVEPDQPIVVVESEKSSLEIVSDRRGIVQHILVTIGQQIAAGSSLIELTLQESAEQEAPSGTALVAEPVVPVVVLDHKNPGLEPEIYASPAVRQMARHLEISLKEIQGTGARGRITIEDLKKHVHSFKHQALTASSLAQSVARDPLALADKQYWGSLRVQPLSKIKKISAQRLLQQWQQIPHVTQFNESVIDNLQSFRAEHKASLAEQGIKLTLLPFIVQAVCRALKKFPAFNAILSADHNDLIYLEAINLGIAVETEEGLLVPVLKNAPGMSVREIALGVQNLAHKARNKQLTPAEMQGHTFTISSLGAFGGTAFTPIIHAPNVAILGVSQAFKKYGPGGQYQEVLPLSLSYDHRVIDGAAGAQFLECIAQGLQDLRLLCLG